MGCSTSPETTEFENKSKKDQIPISSSSPDEIQEKKTEFGKYVGPLKNNKMEGKGNFFGQMVIDMKVISKMIKEKAKENIFIKMVIDTKAILLIINLMEMVNFFGIMAIDMKDNIKMMLWKEEVYIII